MLYDVAYNGILSSSVGTRYPHTSHQWGAGYTISKRVNTVNSEVRLRANYNRNRSVTLLQGTVSGYSSESYNLSPDITTDIGQWMILKYGVSYR